MTENVFNTLNAIDDVHGTALDTQLDVLAACDDAYNKYCTFAESYNGDTDELGFFTEGAIGDEMKSMKGKNENGLVSILAALPRFLIATIRVLTGKTKNAPKNFKAVEGDKEKISKFVNNVLEQDEKSQKSIIAKILDVVWKTGFITVCTVGLAGIVMHFKAPQTISSKGEKGTLTNDGAGFEVCITKNGTVALTKEFVEGFNEDLKTAKELLAQGEKADVGKLATVCDRIYRNIYIAKKYVGTNAKEMGFTGIQDIYNRSNTFLINLQDYAAKIGNAAKEKAGDNALLGIGASAFDHAIRGAATFAAFICEALSKVAEFVINVIKAPIMGIKELFSSNKLSEENHDSKADNEDATSVSDISGNNDGKKTVTTDDNDTIFQGNGLLKRDESVKVTKKLVKKVNKVLGTDLELQGDDVIDNKNSGASVLNTPIKVKKKYMEDDEGHGELTFYKSGKGNLKMKMEYDVTDINDEFTSVFAEEVTDLFVEEADTEETDMVEECGDTDNTPTPTQESADPVVSSWYNK